MGKSPREQPFEIPDLELPKAPPRRVSAGPARLDPAPSRAPKPDVLASGSGSIEIEPWDDGLKSGARAATGTTASVDDLFGKNLFEGDSDDDLALGVAGLELAGPRQEEQNRGADWPSGRSPERSALAIDQAQVESRAGFPPAPASAVIAPLYAWQVLVRRRTLREILARLDRELTVAERQRDELLGRMVCDVRPQLEAEPRLAELLGAAQQLGALTGQRGQALEAVSAQYRSALAEIEARRGKLEGSLAEQRAVLRERAAELARQDEGFRRAEARHKRLQIEIRSAVDVAQKRALAAALPPGTAHPEDAARVTDLQKQAAEHAPEVARLSADRAQAQLAHDAAASAAAAIERDIERATAEQRALDRNFGKQVDLNAAGLSEAENQLRTALADAGRAVLALRSGVSIDALTLQQIAAADAEVARLCTESEHQLRALDACDHAAVQRGYTVAALTCGAVMLLLIALVISAC